MQPALLKTYEMIQFYSPDIAETLTLPESDSGHAVRVLRLREGDTIYVIDGSGTRYRCVITSAHHRHTTVEIVGSEPVPNHWGCRITVAIAPPKNIDRLEWFAEKAVEIGVDRIVMLRCARSERKDVRTDRIEKIVVSAMNHSLKGVMPEIVPMTPIADFLREKTVAQCFMGYCDKSMERSLFVEQYHAGSDVNILIGPEGDFTPEEVALAIDAGYRPVTFGNSRLRTETAALFAVDAVHVINQLKC